MTNDIVIGRNKSDLEKFGKKGVILLGKHFVKMGQVTSLSNPIYMDMVRAHVVFIVGKRGGGKSYTMGVIAEGMASMEPEIKQNLSIILLDTMGVYWTMKYGNKKEAMLLKDWGIEPTGLDVKIYTPKKFYHEYKEKGIATDFPFSVKPSEFSSSDWCMTFDISNTTPVGVLIEGIINKLQEKGENYDIDDIIAEVKKDESSESHIRKAAENLFKNTEAWGVFDKDGTPLKDLAKGGQVTVLDVSCYATMPNGWKIKSLVVGLVAQKLFVERMIARKNEEQRDIHGALHYFSEEEEVKQDFPMVWLVVDECLPYDSQISTDSGLKPIGKIVSEVSRGKKIKVVGYDQQTKQYNFFSVTKGYKRPKRQVMTFITETGKVLNCTSDHKVRSSKGFLEAKNAKNIAIPLIKSYVQDKKLIQARLLGSIVGDGWLASNGKEVGFSGKGNNDDLYKIKNDLTLLGFRSGGIHTVKTRSSIQSVKYKVAKVKGISQSIKTSTNAWKFFKKLSAPVGTKVLSPSKIPSWIMDGSKVVKAEFLAGLMGADGYTMKRNVNVPSDFNPIRLSFNKIVQLEKNAWQFANQLNKLFNDVGVKVSNIAKRSGNIRKDGNKTLKIQITLAKSVKNTISFLENVGYRYCEKKEKEATKWLEYLRSRESIKKKRSLLRTKAIKLHKEKGLGKIRIGKMLDLPSYQIREWIYYGRKSWLPKNLPSFEDWTKKRVKGNHIFVKILEKKKGKEEKVYDLSVAKVHNFVADGFLVHNCHEFLPVKGKTAASDPLITILREGRQPGISLILATQQPGKIHTDVMTQSDTVISHRITAKLDTEALGMLMQSYMREGLTEQLDNLPRVKGAAIIFDDTNERMYPMRIRPRFTWHGGESPIAYHKKQSKFDF